jgi:DNA-binding response OmpR family regulator
MAILIVTGIPDLADVLQSTLRRAGYDTITAHDRAGGWRVWQRAQPELILIDVAQPEPQGWDLCAQIRQAGDTPILLLGTGDGKESAIRGLALGADDYLRVPFSAGELVARVRSLLWRAHLRKTEPPSSGPDAPEALDSSKRAGSERHRQRRRRPS